MILREHHSHSQLEAERVREVSLSDLHEELFTRHSRITMEEIALLSEYLMEQISLLMKREVSPSPPSTTFLLPVMTLLHLQKIRRGQSS